jgi:hypothetical protein
VEVDRAVADAAAAEVGDERLAEAVQQRSAEQDRDAAGAGVGVDLGEVGALDVPRVEQQLAGLRTRHEHTVGLEQAPHDRHVADLRDVAEQALGLAEQGRHHGFGDQVLRTADGDRPLERLAAVHDELVGLQPDALAVLLGITEK